MQQLYQKFQPAQFNGYVAPKKQQPRGAVRDNVTFVDALKNKKKDDGVRSSLTNPPSRQTLPSNHHTSTLKPLTWADDIPDDMEIETINPTRTNEAIKDLSNGTVKGGSMHDQDFQKLVTTQLDAITKQLILLTSSLAFSQDRLSVIEKALDIKVVTPRTRMNTTMRFPQNHHLPTKNIRILMLPTALLLCKNKQMNSLSQSVTVSNDASLHSLQPSIVFLPLVRTSNKY
jgi:hypothetical protein